jgi:hypothetical protein
MSMRNYALVFLWPIGAACGQSRSADAIDSELRVRVNNQSPASIGRRLKLALRSGAPPREWTVLFSAAGLADIIVIEGLRLEGADTLSAVIRVMSASGEAVAVVPVSVAIEPHSYYGLDVWIGKKDPSWLCVPPPVKVPLRDAPAIPDTVYVVLSGMPKNSRC